MVEFLQSYGIWIIFGLFFLFMFWARNRGYGMGCCGGHQQNQVTPKEEEPQK